MINATVDISGLQQTLGALQRATGKDSQTIVRDECRLLAMQISKLVGPNPRQALERRIERDVRSSLLATAPNIDPQHQGTGDIRWISSGPRFLVGVPKALRPPSNVEGIQKIIREKRGKASIEISRRGRQRVYISNRAVITKAQVQQAVRQIKQRVGRFKASWAQTAAQLGEGSIPQWISRHFPTPKNRLINLSNLEDKPSIIFGSASPGARRFSSLIQAAVKIRAKIVATRVRLILSGYRKDIARGIRPLSHASR